MNEPVEELYFQWLYSQVANPKAKGRARTYWVLMRKLFTTEYIIFGDHYVPNDDNRYEDGRELRYEFLMDSAIPEIHQDWMDLGCCMLEMLIGVSRRISFQTDTPADAWFWHILHNLGIANCNDAEGDFTEHVDDVLQRIIFRTYASDGRGGLFPLRRAERDQTQVEIWYQMCAYILENS